jgi:hypothetical protein
VDFTDTHTHTHTHTHIYIYIYIYDVVHLQFNIITFTKFSPPANGIMFLYTIIHNSYMFRQYIVKHGQDIWPKHVGVVYHKYTKIFQMAVKILSIYV